ncbi:methyltransferase domain-containing protein [Niveibacterium sp. SC-1]|uniref:tRNA (guanine(46)-N(7))-methyltransferase TrmB n=1 Tax=Niveibacterium sp. SC-1 TaxID=3135646 RepID=UPI00311E2306
MMYANSRTVESAQAGPHEKLAELVTRHMAEPFRKPISAHTGAAYEVVMRDWDGRAPLLLDAGCGVGWSTLALARAWPDHFVLGVDQSEDRIGRGKPADAPDNLRFVRADLVDFWRLLRRDGLKLDRHYLLYPNPWPKIGQLARRWQGHAVLPEMLALGGLLELRSNWKIYVEEFALAVTQVTGRAGRLREHEAPEPLTPFERKYRDSGQALWRYEVELREGAARGPG